MSSWFLDVYHQMFAEKVRNIIRSWLQETRTDREKSFSSLCLWLCGKYFVVQCLDIYNQWFTGEGLNWSLTLDFTELNKLRFSKYKQNCFISSYLLYFIVALFIFRLYIIVLMYFGLGAYLHTQKLSTLGLLLCFLLFLFKLWQ